MAKITGSRNRYKRKRSKNPTSSTNRPSRSRASSNSSKVTTAGEKYPGGRGQSRVTTERDTRSRKARSTVTQGGGRAKVKIKPKSTGIIGTTKSPTTKTKVTGPPGLGKVKFDPKNRTTPKSKGGGGAIKATLTAGLAGALSSGKLRNPVSKAKKREAAKSIGKYNTRDKDGTVRNRKKVGPKKVGVGKVGTEAQNFDKAFAAARKAGKSSFTWKGKKYNTKMK